MITQVFPYGSVELAHPKKGTFKVNRERVKLYFGVQHEQYKFPMSLQPPSTMH